MEHFLEIFEAIGEILELIIGLIIEWWWYPALIWFMLYLAFR